jgi:hypothetical protein
MNGNDKDPYQDYAEQVLQFEPIARADVGSKKYESACVAFKLLLQMPHSEQGGMD